MNRLDNFKGRIHTLTYSDRIKGGKVSSEKKRQANGLKNLKHGRYSKKLHLLLDCSRCPFLGSCTMKHDGFCTILLKELSHDKRFRKQFLKRFVIDEDKTDLLHLVRLKVELDKQYAMHLKQYFE